MNKTAEIKYWGNPDLFAIRYDASCIEKDFKRLHIMLGGQIIGDSNELCYFSTWIASIQQLYFRIKFKRSQLDLDISPYSRIELYELIKKSGQLEKDFSPEFIYLPKYDSQAIWARCNLSLDETTDAWDMYFLSNNDNVLFFWKGLRDPCPKNQIGLLYTIDIEQIKVEQILAEIIAFFGLSLPDIESKIWK